MGKSQEYKRRKRQRYRARKAAEARANGMCIHCRQDYAVEGAVYCIDCMESLRRNTVVYSTESGYTPLAVDRVLPKDERGNTQRFP